MRYLVLLLLAAACGRPMLRSEPELLPELPRQAVSQLGPVPVLVVDSLRDDAGRLLDGGYHTSRRAIYIRRGIESRTRQWQVYFHEQCHIAIDDAGLANLIPPQIVQTLCDVFATQRVAEMLADRK